MKKLLVLGATSDIAVETLRHFAADGAAFYLVARDQEKLQAVADDLKTRGANTVETAVLDLADVEKHEKLYEEVIDAFGIPGIVYLAYGILPVQEEMETDTAAALHSIHVNFNSAVSLLERAARLLEKEGSGTIAAISSVAGDRVRASNYIYGCAKAGLSGYLSGLRGRMLKNNIDVVDIRPGFVATSMTEDLDKDGPLVAYADTVGRSIHKAILKGRDVVYTPWFWRWIMFIIRHLPGFIFKRMKM